ncbi:hypothetical protein FRC09_010214 [Ceratobasidium sp. 395]|nr:hypothetical protein FRC09_010214 [Ceratobasidium sp. 395]
MQHTVRELYHWSKLKHKNVLELLGVAMFQEQLAMISPWMNNGTLDAYIRQNPNVDRWLLCAQASEGLEYIRGARMVHGDLKAASIFSALRDNNILVSTAGVVKLTDFGNSVMTDQSLGFSATCIAGGGTARWMVSYSWLALYMTKPTISSMLLWKAPELIKREDETVADRSMPADIYAFGMEVMTGRKPYSEYRQEPGATLAAIEGKHPRRPDELSTQTRLGDERWKMLILACWKLKPDQRSTAFALRKWVSAQLYSKR